MKYKVGQVYIDDDGDRFEIIKVTWKYVHGCWIYCTPPHLGILGKTWKEEADEVDWNGAKLDKEYKVRNLLNQIDSMESTNGKS